MSLKTPHYPSDFSDALSPMLVKELRQGLRANTFVLVFVLLQTAMIGFLGMRLLSDTGDSSRYVDYERAMWAVIMVALLGVQPLRGAVAVSDETSQNTLDLVQLTHMSSARMVWGKWVALVCQSLLMTLTILPYQVLFYFFGGVDVVAHFLWVGNILWGSALLTALTVSVSNCSGVVRLTVLGLASFPTGILASDFLRNYGSEYRSTGMPIEAYMCFLFFGIVAICFLMALGAARIGLTSENSAVKVRSLALLGWVIGLVGACFAPHREIVPWLIFPMVFIFWAGLEGMIEKANALPSTYVPWVRRNRVVQWGGKLFYQGWGSGLFYVVLTTCLLEVIAYVGVVRSGSGFTSSVYWGIFHFGMATIFPGALLSVLPSVSYKHWFCVAFHILGIAWFLRVRNGDWATEVTKNLLVGLSPTSAFLWAFNSDYPKSGNVDAFVVGNVVAFGVECLAMWLLARKLNAEWAVIQRGESLARQLLKRSKASGDAGAESTTLKGSA